VKGNQLLVGRDHALARFPAPGVPNIPPHRAPSVVGWVPSSVVWSEDATRCWPPMWTLVVELAGRLERRDIGTPGAGSGQERVTANKKLIAFTAWNWSGWPAAKAGTEVRRGGRGRIPVILPRHFGSRGWPAIAFERIEGILNGTCNFILSKMGTGGIRGCAERSAGEGVCRGDPTEMLADSMRVPSWQF